MQSAALSPSRMSTRPAPRSMVLLRRAADAAGYAAVGVVEDGAAYKPAPGAGVASKLMLASLVCLVGMAFAIY